MFQTFELKSGFHSKGAASAFGFVKHNFKAKVPERDTKIDSDRSRPWSFIFCASFSAFIFLTTWTGSLMGMVSFPEILLFKHSKIASSIGLTSPRAWWQVSTRMGYPDLSRINSLAYFATN